MAASKINTRQLNNVVSSIGITDANKVVVTDSTGKIAIATLPDINTALNNNAIAYAIALGGI